MTENIFRAPSLSVLSCPDNYPTTNILISYLAKREAYRPILFSANEVFCGPDCETTSEAGLLKTIQTSVGVYDIQEVVSQLPDSQHPELFIVKADCTGRNFPINTKSLHCPRVLVLGNTQHLNLPIRKLLAYAEEEQFDFILSDHKRQHLHYFVEAGFKNVFWLPALNMFPRPQLAATTTTSLSFVGQIGKWHPYRSHILNSIDQAKIPISKGFMPHSVAAQTYAKSTINLNCSLNGDMNLRIFEVLSSGGFLLTDTLSKESGMDLIFDKGVHYQDYKNTDELLEKIKHYQNNPEKALQIAQAGLQKFWTDHDPRLKVQQLMAYIYNNELDDRYAIDLDKRSLFPVKHLSDVKHRVSKYEFIQELQLNQVVVNVLFLSTGETKLRADLSDLKRVILSDPMPESSNTIEIWDCVIIDSEQSKNCILTDLIPKHPLKSLIIDGPFDLTVSNNLLSLGFEHADQDIPGVYLLAKPAIIGHELKRRGDISTAILFFKTHIKQQPPDLKEALNLAELLVEQNNLSEALVYFKHILSYSRFHQRALESLTEISLINADQEQAINYLEDALQGYPDNVLYINTLAELYMKRGLYTQAYLTYNKSLQVNEDQPDIQAALNFLQQKGIPGKKYSMIRPQRIMLFTNLFPPQEFGGYGRLMYDFANMLRNRGHIVKVLTVDALELGDRPEREEHVNRSLKLFGHWSEGKVVHVADDQISVIIKQNLKTVEKFIEDFEPDLCLAGNLDLIGWQGLGILLEHTIPVIHHLGNKELPYEIINTPRSPLYRLATCSSWLKNSIIDSGYPLSKVEVVYPGAKVNEFVINSYPQYNELKIAYASILQPYKGPQVLLEALAILNSRGINFSCTLAGATTDTEFVDQLREYAVQYNINDKISFVGNLSRDELKHLYATHNVLVFPSVFNEPFGISQVEAMAAGLPVFGSNCDGCKEVITPHKTGMITERENAVELAEALINLSRDPGKWATLGKAAQKGALEVFDIEQSVDKLEQIFKELNRQRKRLG